MTLNHLVWVRVPVGRQNLSKMKQCAVVLNGTDVIKVSNLKRKYNKIVNNSEMKILEECSSEDLEDKYLYWKNLLTKSEDTQGDEILKYHFRNSRGETISSIYPNLDNIPNINKEEWYAVD